MPFDEDVDDRPELGLVDLDLVVATQGPVPGRVDLGYVDAAAGQRLQQGSLGGAEPVQQRRDGVPGVHQGEQEVLRVRPPPARGQGQPVGAAGQLVPGGVGRLSGWDQREAREGRSG
jgi:hypothetical protein